jgi:uncharacterized OsmC-like protein
MSDAPTFALSLEQRERFLFDVTFDGPGWPVLRVDEPQPLGDGSAPNASRLLGAAVGNCLAASLLFCLQKARVPVAGLRAEVRGELARNEKGRLRIGAMSVVIRPSLEGVGPERIARCLELFEDFCVVTQSVREGIAVHVSVEPEGVSTGG